MATLIGYDNRVQTGALSFGSESDARPGSNVAIDHGQPPWQTAATVLTAADGAWLQIDAGSAVDWRLFGLFRTNLTTSVSLRYMLGTTAGGSDVYDQTDAAAVASGFLQAVHVADAAYTARYCRIEINDSTNPDGVLQIGLAFAGDAWTPDCGAAVGASEDIQNRDDVTMSRGGQAYPNRRYAMRALSFRLPVLTEAERYGDLAALHQKMTEGRNVLAIPSDAFAYLNKSAIFGRAPQIGGAAWRSPTYRETTITIEERL